MDCVSLGTLTALLRHKENKQRDPEMLWLCGAAHKLCVYRRLTNQSLLLAAVSMGLAPVGSSAHLENHWRAQSWTQAGRDMGDAVVASSCSQGWIYLSWRHGSMQCPARASSPGRAGRYGSNTGRSLDTVQASPCWRPGVRKYNFGEMFSLFHG